MGRHWARPLLPGTDTVLPPTIPQAEALWAADQLKAISWDGKGDGHVMGMESWQGPSVLSQTHNHQRDPLLGQMAWPEAGTFLGHPGQKR